MTAPARERLRPNVARLVAQGLTEREIAKRLRVSGSTVWQIKQDLRLTRQEASR